MAKVIVVLKIMPESPDVNFSELRIKIEKEIKAFGGEVGKVEEEPIGYGLSALKLYFVMEESRGSTDALEENIKKVKGVNSVDVIDVRRAVG